MSRKKNATQEYEDNFDKLNEDLNELAEIISDFAKNTNHKNIEPEIKRLMNEMFKMAKKIGGPILEHTRDLKLDLNLFLKDKRPKEITPKIFQDFQVLKNELRRL
jgi:hypothetical protein